MFVMHSDYALCTVFCLLCLPTPPTPSTYQFLSQINDFWVCFMAYLVNQGYKCSHQTGTIFWSLVGSLVGARLLATTPSLPKSLSNKQFISDRWGPLSPSSLFIWQWVTGSVVSGPYTDVPSCYVFVIALAGSCPEDSVSQPLSLSSNSSVLSSTIVLEP